MTGALGQGLPRRDWGVAGEASSACSCWPICACGTCLVEGHAWALHEVVSQRIALWFAAQPGCMRRLLTNLST